MLARFSLYGFLKNQLYFEPFFAIILLGRGLDFFTIGLLFAIQDVVTNLLEVPSGWVADTWGRRRSMILSFLAYLASFVLFAFATRLVTLAPAAVCFGVGEAFRSGTHKAMIFEWLRSRGRLGERTRVYGFTRSWSQVGSAVAVVISAGLALWLDELRWLFLITCVPYGLGLVNFLGYPASVEPDAAALARPSEGFVGTLRMVFGRPTLRHLILESCAMQGVYKLLVPYMPVVLALSGLPSAGGLGDVASGGVPVASVLWIAGVGAGLHLLGAAGSFLAHKVAAPDATGAPRHRRLWLGVFVVLCLQVAGVHTGQVVPAALGFIAFAFLYNAWRPAFLTRFDVDTPPDRQAMVLSVESQANTAFTALLAPVAGAVVDRWGLIAVFLFGLLLTGVALVLPGGREKRLT